jgi:uncharacterized protein YkwD
MARRVGLATALAVLFTCMVGGASPAAAAKKRKRACAAVSAVPQETTLSRAYDAVLCLVNQERARRGLRALRRSAELTQAAVDHSSDMVTRRYFAHASLEGETARERVLRTGYFRGSANGKVEEALAVGWAQLSTPRALVSNLMRSPSHQSILLSRRLRDVGIGLVLGAPQPQPGLSGATLTLTVARR